MVASTQARVTDLCSFAATAAQELVADTVRDTHRAVAQRTFSVLEPRIGPPAAVARRVHDAIAGTVHTSVRLGFLGAALGLKVAADAGAGAPVEAGARGIFVRTSLNGLVGDRFAAEGSRLALTTSVRVGGADVPLDRLASAFPEPGRKVAVLLHGLSEDETCWNWRSRPGVPTTLEVLVAAGWTPVLLRSNTGLPVRENGAAVSSLLQDLVAGWPVQVERIVLIGHSMGGLIHRAASAVTTAHERPWTDLLTDVVTLGTPHLGAPIARGISRGCAALARLPETAPVGRILEMRSAGVRDLEQGLPDLPAPEHVRFRLVSASLTRSPDHPVGRVVGDLLVQVPSAQPGSDLFPRADTLHVSNADHFDILNHPRVHAALRGWLADSA
ncbi:esterase/lipase family protein [Nocardioides alcanivorans]|uniref:esterase/lipase family protein n=1 Tax=Nocardioides alcanivorans TaxID=2897352 RepID=UPI001F384371|nr:GPI inositol-deacylase [Nocardioides alcanivorans]